MERRGEERREEERRGVGRTVGDRKQRQAGRELFKSLSQHQHSWPVSLIKVFNYLFSVRKEKFI